MFLKINRIQFPVYNLGPGKRLAIWLQGCTLSCMGCINPELWDKNGGKNIDVTTLAANILQIKNSFDGITITGGEPFEQYEALITFSTFIKSRSALNILVYSGFYIEELEERFPDKTFCKTIDFLIDGRFVNSLAGNDNIRGSSNQNFYTFENGKYSRQNDQIFSGKWSLNLTKENQVFMAGVPKKNELKTLTDYLKDSGINLKFNNV